MNNIDKITDMYDVIIGVFNNDASWYEYPESELRVEYFVSNSIYVVICNKIAGIMKDEKWLKTHKNFYIRDDEFFVYNDRIVITFSSKNITKTIERSGQSTKEMIFELQFYDLDNDIIELLVGINNTKCLIPDGHLLYLPRIERIKDITEKFNLIRTGQIL